MILNEQPRIYANSKEWRAVKQSLHFQWKKKKQNKNELARITAPNDLHNTFFLLLIQKYLWIKSKPER